MKEEKIRIQNIPAIVIGDNSEKVFLFIHGKDGNKEEARAFAEVVCKKGYQVIGIDLPKHGERKNEESELFPWTVIPELHSIMEYLKRNYKQISVRANSIGAMFAMMAFQEETIEKYLLVSPILDMKKLIENMMKWANVTLDELKTKREIKTDFGETLSYDYYEYIKQNPIKNQIKNTYILYGENDNLTDKSTVDHFVCEYNSNLTVMKNGEHWFHTTEELEFLKKWEEQSTH